jgi:flagellar biosynthesis GTPase FlhF
MKTYFATTVEAALALARKELGPEAMLVHSRPTPEDLRSFGQYEVLFAADLPEDPQPRTVAPPTQLPTLRRRLEASGVEPALARDIIQSTLRKNPRDVALSLCEEMESRIAADPNLSTGPSIFVGPPGRGKTTTLIKLAIAHGIAKRRPVRLLSLDNLRIGAMDQIRSFAAILGVPFHSCGTVGELHQQLSHASNSELTLIDTSGYGPHDLDPASALPQYLSSHPEISVHFVLRADAKTADSIGAVQRYAKFNISHLVYTGMDEVETFGSVFSTAALTRKPLSFLGLGQRIPEDIEAASSSGLVRLVLNEQKGVMSAAA